MVISPVKARSVRATADFKIGEIVLAPMTTSIMFKSADQHYPAGSAVIKKVYKKTEWLNAVLLQSGGLKLQSKEFL